MDPRAVVELAGAMRSQWWPAEKLRRLQTRRLDRMLGHARSRVPYYQRLDLDVDALPAFEALRRFPYMVKADIQSAGTSLVARGYEPEALPSSRTSGSTGEPTTTWFDPASWRFTRHVLKWRRVLSSVSPLGLRLLRVSESLPLSAGASLGPRLPGVFEVSTVSIALDPVQALAHLRRFRPSAIYSYPSWLREVIEAARADGGGVPPVACIMTSSEVLTPADREAISTAFSGRVLDVYGNTELKEVAWQCAHGRYHVNVESVLVEIDSATQPTTRPNAAVAGPKDGDGRTGEIVLTGLVNRAMPLIRFRTGDLGRWAAGDCPCGRASPALEDIQGRVMDMMELPGGRRISPYLLTTAIEQDEGIRHYRIEQYAPDQVVIRYRSRGDRPVGEALITERVRDVLGAGIAIDCLSDPDMALPARGKRSVYSRVARPSG